MLARGRLAFTGASPRAGDIAAKIPNVEVRSRNLFDFIQQLLFN